MSINSTIRRLSSLGDRLVTERFRLGLSMEELATYGDVSRGSQRLYEINDRLPPLTYFMFVAKAGVDLNVLLHGASVSAVAADAIPAERVSAALRMTWEVLEVEGNDVARWHDADELLMSLISEIRAMTSPGIDTQRLADAVGTEGAVAQLHHLGDQLRLERQRLRWSRNDMAFYGEVSNPSQRLYESNDRLPSLMYLLRLTRSGADFNFLLHGGPRDDSDESSIHVSEETLAHALRLVWQAMQIENGSAGRLKEAESLLCATLTGIGEIKESKARDAIPSSPSGLPAEATT